MGKRKKKKSKSKNSSATTSQSSTQKRTRKDRRHDAKARQQLIMSWLYPSPDSIRRLAVALVFFSALAAGLIYTDTIMPVKHSRYIVQGTRIETRRGKGQTRKVKLFRLSNERESFETTLRSDKAATGYQVEFTKTALFGHRLAEIISRPDAKSETGFTPFKTDQSTNFASKIMLPLLGIQSLLLLLLTRLPDQFIDKLTMRSGNSSLILFSVGSILAYFLTMIGSMFMIVGFGVFLVSFATDFESNITRRRGLTN